MSWLCFCSCVYVCGRDLNEKVHVKPSNEKIKNLCFCAFVFTRDVLFFCLCDCVRGQVVREKVCITPSCVVYRQWRKIALAFCLLTFDKRSNNHLDPSVTLCT